jgi:hypothetical protein
MKLGPLPDAMEPDIHGVGTRWIRSFMAFQPVRRTRTVMLMVPVCPESGFWRCRSAPAHQHYRVRTVLLSRCTGHFTLNADGLTQIDQLWVR